MASGLAHDVFGHGDPAIVFIHGLGCDRTDWGEQIEAFAPRHRVLTLDLPGHGASPPSPRQTRIEAQAQDVAALIMAAEASPAVLVGHSLGCRIVIEAAALLVGSVAGVVLIDGSLRTDPGPGTGPTPAQFSGMMRAYFRQLVGDGMSEARASFIAERAAERDPVFLAALIADIARYDQAVVADRLGELDVPVLAFQTSIARADGHRTNLLPGESTPFLDLLRARVARLTEASVPVCGHFPQIEQPEATTQRIADFMATLV